MRATRFVLTVHIWWLLFYSNTFEKRHTISLQIELKEVAMGGAEDDVLLSL